MNDVEHAKMCVSMCVYILRVYKHVRIHTPLQIEASQWYPRAKTTSEKQLE